MKVLKTNTEVKWLKIQWVSIRKGAPHKHFLQEDP
jgi:hypothetical protein